MRVGDHEQLELLEAFHRIGNAGDRVAAMPEYHHGADNVALVDLLLWKQDAVEPPGRGDPGRLHVLLAGPRRAPGLGRHFVEPALEVVVLDLPDASPMLPSRFRQAVIERQRGDIEPEIGRALHVGVAAENVGARPGLADVAREQQRDAGGAHVGRADRLLRLTHAPDQGGGLLLREFLGDALELLARNTGDALHFLRWVLLDLLQDLVHAVDTLRQEFLVLPAVLHDVPHHPHQHRDVGAGADAHVFGAVRGRAGEARIDDDEVRPVDFLSGQDVLHRDRVSLRRVAAHDDHGLGVAQVVVRVRLRSVTPRVGHARHRRRMADAGLVIDRIGAPEGAELPEQVGALVGELGRTEPEHRIRARLGTDRRQLVADFVDGLVPGDPLPLAAHQLHRVFQPSVAVDDFANGGALGAMGAAVDRAFPGRLLADPDAVLHLRRDRAAHRAMGAHVLLDLDRCAGAAGAAVAFFTEPNWIEPTAARPPTASPERLRKVRRSTYPRRDLRSWLVACCGSPRRSCA